MLAAILDFLSKHMEKGMSNLTLYSWKYLGWRILLFDANLNVIKNPFLIK